MGNLADIGVDVAKLKEQKEKYDQKENQNTALSVNNRKLHEDADNVARKIEVMAFE